jgi:hypothetical protein
LIRYQAARRCEKLTNRSFVPISLIEIHTFLVTLVRQFDFSLPDDGRKIRKIRTMLLTPVVAGEEDKGPQMPLKVTALRSE